ncbi:hypothetical protein Hanom_Chr16g01496261 [Helianthus anomalus]
MVLEKDSGETPHEFMRYEVVKVFGFEECEVVVVENGDDDDDKSPP